MNDFIHELKHDHEVIQRAVAGMSAVADLLEESRPVKPSVLTDIVQFLRVFADQCHHTKEDRYLFPLLETIGNDAVAREVRLLENEHRSAEELARQLSGLATAYVRNPEVLRPYIAAVLRRLVEIYPAHIRKEDHLFLLTAGRVLSQPEQVRLGTRFARVEEKLGADVHRAFEKLADRLESVTACRTLGACPLCSPAA